MTDLQDTVEDKYGGRTKTEAFFISLRTKIGNRSLKPGFSQFRRELKASLIMFALSFVDLCRPVLNLVGIIVVDIPAAWRISNSLKRDGILQDEGEVSSEQ